MFLRLIAASSGPSFLLIDIAATWRSGARGEARLFAEVWKVFLSFVTF